MEPAICRRKIPAPDGPSGADAPGLGRDCPTRVPAMRHISTTGRFTDPALSDVPPASRSTPGASPRGAFRQARRPQGGSLRSRVSSRCSNASATTSKLLHQLRPRWAEILSARWPRRRVSLGPGRCRPRAAQGDATSTPCRPSRWSRRPMKSTIHRPASITPRTARPGGRLGAARSPPAKERSPCRRRRLTMQTPGARGWFTSLPAWLAEGCVTPADLAARLLQLLLVARRCQPARQTRLCWSGCGY